MREQQTRAALRVPWVVAYAAALLVATAEAAPPSHVPPLAVAKQQKRLDFLGDPLPELALLRIGTTRLQHRGTIDGVTVSGDGKSLASWGQDRLVRVWQAADGKPVAQFELSAYGAWALAFAANDKELVAVSQSPEGASAKGEVRRWDLATGKLLQAGKDHPHKFSSTVVQVAVACLPGNHCVVAETAGAKVSLYWPGTNKPGLTLGGHVGRVMSVALARDGKTVAALGEDGNVIFWSTASGKQTARLVALDPKTESLAGNIANIAVSADASRVAFSLPDGSTWLLNATGDERKQLPARGQNYALGFAPDGKTLFTGHLRLRAWDAQTGDEIALLKDPYGPIAHLALARDGRSAVFADEADQIRMVDIATGKILLHCTGSCRAGLAYTPDGKHLALASAKGHIALWETARLGETPQPFQANPAMSIRCADCLRTFAFLPDGKRLATVEASDHYVCRLYDVATAKVTLTLDMKEEVVFAVVFSPDGKRLATVGYRNSAGSFAGNHWFQVVRLWDAATGKELPLPEELGATAYAVAFHPAGGALVARHLCKAARYPPRGFDVAPMPIEDLLETTRLWDLQRLHVRLRFEDPAAGKNAVAGMGYNLGRSSDEPLVFSADGRFFATTADGGGIVLFETGSGQARLHLQGHMGPVTALAITPDAKALVSVSGDTTLVVWDITALKTGKKLSADAEALWNLLADTNAERAGQAVWSLVAAPEAALTVIRQHIKPIAPGKNAIPQLIVDLNDAKFAVREKAMHSLAALGPAAEANLLHALKAPASLEMRQRLERLLTKIQTSPPGPQHLQQVRALEVLERLRTPAAIELLRELAAGAEGAWLTSEARGVLARQSPR